MAHEGNDSQPREGTDYDPRAPHADRALAAAKQRGRGGNFTQTKEAASDFAKEEVLKLVYQGLGLSSEGADDASAITSKIMSGEKLPKGLDPRQAKEFTNIGVMGLLLGMAKVATELDPENLSSMAALKLVGGTVKGQSAAQATWLLLKEARERLNRVRQGKESEKQYSSDLVWLTGMVAGGTEAVLLSRIAPKFLKDPSSIVTFAQNSADALDTLSEWQWNRSVGVDMGGSIIAGIEDWLNPGAKTLSSNSARRPGSQAGRIRGGPPSAGSSAHPVGPGFTLTPGLNYLVSVPRKQPSGARAPIVFDEAEVPVIRGHAAGGFTTKDHVALVHKNEGILPLGKVPEIFAKTIEKAGGGAGRGPVKQVHDVTININVHGTNTAEEFRQKVVPLLRSELVSLFEEMSAALDGSPDAFAALLQGGLPLAGGVCYDASGHYERGGAIGAARSDD